VHYKITNYHDNKRDALDIISALKEAIQNNAIHFTIEGE